MELKESIIKRRAFRSFEKVKININDISDVLELAKLSPSCFNNQPWRVIACISNETLEKLKIVYSKGNEWCYNASAVLIIWSKKEFDCIIKDRVYYQFDVGIFTGYLILLLTEKGYVAHPIAGFSPSKVKEIFSLDNDADIITLIIIGKREEDLNKTNLSEDQKEREINRPERKKLEDFVTFL